MKLIGILLVTVAMAATVCAQRPRSVDTATDASKAVPAPAPQTVNAKYEGGVFGYNKTMEGTLSFDDANRRLLFRNKERREVLFIPYDSVTSAFSDTQKRQPKAATVLSSVPVIFTLPAHFIKTKVRYLTIQYSDPDTRVAGITSFRLANRELVESVVYALANKAGLTPRGEIYIRKQDTTEAKKTKP
jgi:hypothetical protein